ncbi:MULTISPECIES: DUF6177 family protein [Nocardiopsis]|uniref:Uncharacterized protein n=1 Tax=Nocardiopsis sinuspersici TaxID=501010 RepID=A0A1V3C4F2_9ACTN|nr:MULTISPECIES: DUF6177 family protein [Nocardiopsis]OOC55573.1 hypothetical protein NOSIN_18530 [Nocardiopsis sinuspersici]
MSHDVVALLAESPGRRSLMDALAAAGPDLRVRLIAEGTVVHLRDGSGRLVLAVQAAQRLAVSAEADRLLTDGISDGLPAQPLWVEVRATEPPGTDTAATARRFAHALVERHGGVVWEPESRLPRDDAHLLGATDHPAVSVLTARNAVLVQDRPLVPLSSWLVDALAEHGRRGLGLQLVTPSTSLVTHALRWFLSRPGATWAVRAPDGRHYDGFNGLPLVWDPATGFVPDPGVDAGEGPNEAFRASADEDLGTHLHVDLRVDHPVDEHLELGGTVELLAEHLAGAPPAVWGVCEPLSRAWDAAQVTAMARHRSPRETLLAFTGRPGSAREAVGVREEGVRPFAGSLRVSRTPSGVRERILFSVGHRSGEEPDLEALTPLVRELASRDGLRSMTVHRALGRADLAYAPRWAGVSVPVGLAVGSEGVLEAGRRRALAAPVAGTAFGSPMTPLVWYRIGDGVEADGWDRFRELMDHLRPR